jgi:hypothetical protein
MRLWNKGIGLLTLVMVIVIASSLAARSEYVLVLKLLDNDKRAVIQRSNGEYWIIDKGIGASSFWRYEGKQVIIYSPGLFCGVGSQLILPDSNQRATIWKAKELDEMCRSLLFTTPPRYIAPYSPPKKIWGNVRATDLLTAEEKRRAGLSKLSYSELEALNKAFARILGVLTGEEATDLPTTSLCALENNPVLRDLFCLPAYPYTQDNEISSMTFAEKLVAWIYDKDVDKFRNAYFATKVQTDGLSRTFGFSPAHR